MISNELNGLTLANVQCRIHEKNIIWYFTQEQSIYSLQQYLPAHPSNCVFMN